MWYAGFFDYNAKNDTFDCVMHGEYDDCAEIFTDLDMFTGEYGYVVVSKVGDKE